MNTEYTLIQDVSKFERFSIKICSDNGSFQRTNYFHSDLGQIHSATIGISGTNLIENFVRFKITDTSKLILSYKGYSGVYISEVVGF